MKRLLILNQATNINFVCSLWQLNENELPHSLTGSNGKQVKKILTEYRLSHALL